MDRRTLFPDAWADNLLERVSAWWTLDYPLPMPTTVPVCPMCSPFSAGGGRMVVKDWQFHERKRTGSANPFRCDVRFKCIDCGHVPMFGVWLPEPYFRNAPSVGGWISWRRGKQILAQAGYFEEDA